MSSIYLPDDLKARLFRAARRRGYTIDRGRQSQLSEYVAYLVRLDEQAGQATARRNTLDQALGLLARHGQSAPTDADVQKLLDERRMHK
jgi:hypothetical protein